MLNLKIARIFIIYISVTFLLYAFGPIIYTQDYRLDSAIFLFFICISFYLGCLSVPIKKYKNSIVVQNKEHKSLKILLICSIFVSLMLIIENVSKTGFQFSFNLGEIYIKSHEKEENLAEISRIGQIVVLFSPLRALSMILGAYNFFRITNKYKVFIIVNFVLYIFYEVFCLGTQKGVGNVVIFALIAFYVYFLQIQKVRQFYKNTGLLLFVFVSFFIATQLSRSTAYGSDFTESNFYAVDTDSIVYLLGENIGDGLMGFILYLTHGYHGLGFCLQLPFEWTKFYGSSFALSSYLEQYFGFPNLTENTYPIRMEKVYGWPGLMFWPTAFAWLASDFTFIGVVLLMYFIGRIFCICFKEAYYYSNPLSITILGYLSILIIYLPSNNQLFQTRESFIGFITLFSIWLIKHKKYNY